MGCARHRESCAIHTPDHTGVKRFLSFLITKAAGYSSQVGSTVSRFWIKNARVSIPLRPAASQARIWRGDSGPGRSDQTTSASLLLRLAPTIRIIGGRGRASPLLLLACLFGWGRFRTPPRPAPLRMLKNATEGGQSAERTAVAWLTPSCRRRLVACSSRTCGEHRERRAFD